MDLQPWSKRSYTMPTPSLSEQQWEKILRLVNSPSYYVVDYVPHVPVGESFLSLDYYVEREYLPRALDRYALICLVALYTWADYVDIVPGYSTKDDTFPPVIVAAAGGGVGPGDVDRLIRSTLRSKKFKKTFIFLEHRGILIELKLDFRIVFYGLNTDDARLVESLATANGLFLKYRNEDEENTPVDSADSAGSSGED